MKKTYKYVQKWNGEDNKRTLKMTALVNAEYWNLEGIDDNNTDHVTETEL